MKLALEQLRASPEPATTATAPARPPVTAGDCGLLLIRLTFGLLMAGHGAQKLFGIFGGPGLSATGKGFAALGYHPGISTPLSAVLPSSSAAWAWPWGCSPRWRPRR